MQTALWSHFCRLCVAPACTAVQLCLESGRGLDPPHTTPPHLHGCPCPEGFSHFCLPMPLTHH